MEKVIGGVLGLAAFLAVLVAGILRGMAVGETLWRSAVAGGVGYLVGWMLFGKVGLNLVKETAAEPEVPEAASKPPVTPIPPPEPEKK